MTLAIFSSCGKIPVVNERLHTCNKGVKQLPAVVLKTFEDMLSYPALPNFKLTIILHNKEIQTTIILLKG